MRLIERVLAAILNGLEWGAKTLSLVVEYTLNTVLKILNLIYDVLKQVVIEIANFSKKLWNYFWRYVNMLFFLAVLLFALAIPYLVGLEFGLDWLTYVGFAILLLTGLAMLIGILSGLLQRGVGGVELKYKTKDVIWVFFLVDILFLIFSGALPSIRQPRSSYFKTIGNIRQAAETQAVKTIDGFQNRHNISDSDSTQAGEPE